MAVDANRQSLGHRPWMAFSAPAASASAAAGAVRLAVLPDDGLSGLLCSFDGTVGPW